MLDQLLQFGGRLHPLVLHLPIGVLAGLIVFELLAAARGKPLERSTRLTLAWLVAVSGAAAAATGYLLGREDTYGGDSLDIHRWLGIGTGIGCVVLALLATIGARRLYTAVLVVTTVGLAPAGHLGASMTHGENFLFEPFSPPRPAPSASVYETRIAPIISKRCALCHSEAKAEGGLVLSTPQGILAGGDSGTAIEAGDPDRSEIIVRIRLDIGDDDHMPPKSKKQLTPDEVDTLVQWIASGASFDAAEGAAPSRNDGASAAPTKPQPPVVNRAPADAIAKLRDAQVHAEAIDPESGLLWVSFAAMPSTTDEQAAALLAPLAGSIGDLSLARTNAGEATLRVVGRMTHLRSLDLSATPISPPMLAPLRQLAQLKELRLTRTRLDDSAVATIESLPALTTLHVWSSGVSDAAIAALRTARPSLTLETGDLTAPPPLTVEPEPKFTNAAAPAPPAPASAPSLDPVNDVCPISGAAANPQFSVVHKGRVIALCCEKCAAKFLLEPDKYPVAPRK